MEANRGRNRERNRWREKGRKGGGEKGGYSKHRHLPLLLLIEKAEVTIKHRERKVAPISVEGENFLLWEHVATVEECSLDRLCKLHAIFSSGLPCE